MSEAFITDENKLLFALGLCARARKMTIGAPMICEALKAGGANAPKLVIESSDTSENTHKRLTDRCRYYGVKHIRLCADGDTLSKMIGKTSAVAAVAISDNEFCKLAGQYIRFTESDQI